MGFLSHTINMSGSSETLIGSDEIPFIKPLAVWAVTNSLNSTQFN
jgi:hypothetical protein